MPAVLSVPGDVLAGAAAAGCRPGRRTLLAAGSSLCLYEAGMALNDWADRDIDAVERPGRPIPSGRITPAAALGTAVGLTAAGLALAGTAGRPTLATATALAATVWAYDLHLKNTPAGPLAMACARGLDVLQGAVSAGAGGEPRVGESLVGEFLVGGASVGKSTHVIEHAVGRAVGCAVGHAVGRAAGKALPSAALLGAHTFAVTTVSRREAQGSSSAVPLAALGAVVGVGAVVAGGTAAVPKMPREAVALVGGAAAVPTAGREVPALASRAAVVPTAPPPTTMLATAKAASVVAAVGAALYAGAAARPFFHAALNPSPYLLQRAVGSGIRAMIPLQAALSARAGAPATGAALLALLPAARRLSRKVSPT
ncbi:SCO3242 family prenyltransferase [Streptomyces rimosus]|uniref:SCO3242 family prenyltransferase n=1 Tax=Streptomyces rimosus TaxID=1927 RepID=UPI000A43E01D|nr:UbiA family prenyltransferase [Streptomyces rimosus]